MKLVLGEAETPSLVATVADRDVISSELALTEVPRAVRRRLSQVRRGPHRDALAAMENVLSGVSLVPVDRDILIEAGAYDEPSLRALDAIHVASALALGEDIEAFVSYDQRQLHVAGRAGLAARSPAAG